MPWFRGRMATTVSLQQTTFSVDPGSSVSTEMRIRNNGSVVDQFSFQPLGDAAPWITVTPPMVRLFPDTDAVVTITIAPPRNSSSRAGIATWAVKAVPQEDPAGATVTEGTVDVGAFVEIGAELQPVTGRGRLTGRFDLAIDNRGNVMVPVHVNGTDSEQALGFEISHRRSTPNPVPLTSPSCGSSRPRRSGRASRRTTRSRSWSSRRHGSIAPSRVPLGSCSPHRWRRSSSTATCSRSR